MRYNGITYYDTGNAHGLSTVLWVTGCSHNCEGCHNPKTWNPENGKIYTSFETRKIIESLSKPFIKNFVISGGDPLYESNKIKVLEICQEVKRACPNIDIIIYTGYKLEELTWEKEFLFPYIDYIVDGKFEKDNRPKELELRGSLNQQCYHITDNGKTIKNISEEYFKR